MAAVRAQSSSDGRASAAIKVFNQELAAILGGTPSMNANLISGIAKFAK